MKTSQIMERIYRNKGMCITEGGRLVCVGRFEVVGPVGFPWDRF